MQKSSSRLLYIDSARGLGMLLVIIGHVYALDNPFFSVIYGVNVTLFFMLTGYMDGLKNTKRPFISQLKNDFKKIMLPYIFYSILVLVWQLIRLYVFDFGSTAEIKSNVFDMVSLYGISSLWFLSTLFIAKTIFSSLSANISKRSLYVVIALICFGVIFGLLRLLPGLEEENAGLIIKLLKRVIKIASRSLAAVYFMIAGLLICELEKKLTKAKGYVVCCCLAFSVGIAGFVYNGITDFNTLVFSNQIIYFISPVLALPFILLICKQIKTRELFCIMGEYSLMIMSTHLIFLSFAQIAAYYITAITGMAAIYWTTAMFVFVLACEAGLIVCREAYRRKHSSEV